MKPIRLEIVNFLCHSHSIVDFNFDSALILGKIEHSDLYSNGVGKSAIFQAIEYALFNQSNFNLDKIIRDDQDSAKVIFDFQINQTFYRIIRFRNRKGTSDLSLYQLKSDWEDISSRRNSDTEKDLAKLIKINFAAFRSTVYFMQQDLSGLATTTPTKRKAILKDSLQLAIYSKLEKLAKEKHSTIFKQSDKLKFSLENIGDPESDVLALSQQKENIHSTINELKLSSSILDENKSNIISTINNITSSIISIENRASSLKEEKTLLIKSQNSLANDIQVISQKKAAIQKQGKTISAEVEKLKSQKQLLGELSSKEELHSKHLQYEELKTKITTDKVKLEQLFLLKEELSIPIPDGECKHCRQTLSPEHKKNCQNKINETLKSTLLQIKELKSLTDKNQSTLLSIANEISFLNKNDNSINSITASIAQYSSQLNGLRPLYTEYSNSLSLLNEKVISLSQQVEENTKNISSIFGLEYESLKSQLDVKGKALQHTNKQLSELTAQINQITSNLAVLEHKISKRAEDLSNKNKIQTQLKLLDKELTILPMVINGFSSTGIPNLIIKNILDDLQTECNNLLPQLHPGLSLSFSIEKTKTDGTQDDTLDIDYFINDKIRDFEQLSGAQKLAAVFSLKLGLTFLLQKIMDVEFKLLLLDEIDAALDKASVDAYADIVKLFQKDFTILVITHNDRLKDKFSNVILVEQNSDKVSKVVS